MGLLCGRKNPRDALAYQLVRAVTVDMAIGRIDVLVKAFLVYHRNANGCLTKHLVKLQNLQFIATGLDFDNSIENTTLPLLKNLQ